MPSSHTALPATLWPRPGSRPAGREFARTSPWPSRRQRRERRQWRAGACRSYRSRPGAPGRILRCCASKSGHGGCFQFFQVTDVKSRSHRHKAYYESSIGHKTAFHVPYRRCATIQLGLRMLRSDPGSTPVALPSLAIGIAVKSTLFPGINAVPLHPRPGRWRMVLWICMPI
jgi:hypothetical protein